MSNPRKKNITAHDPLRAAFALNMCMVSLSQIVDYGDVDVLQQEYDTILNNLCIENVIKDDSLLSAYMKILDTCHFYLLHAKDKEILKKKQSARLKRALAKSFAGGANIVAMIGNPSPWAIAAGLAVMVGITAVKYKSEREQARLENEIDEWELDKTALEQLHNLRRTLFETAWRLSESYGYGPEFRLTEKLIGVYDAILEDANPISRYERLTLIKDNFNAYPLFHYYRARAALESFFVLAEKDDKTAEVYRRRAKESYDRFFGMKKFNNLLREDVMTASAYLDRTMFSSKPKELLENVEEARRLAGADCEIIQGCAFRYMELFASQNTDEIMRKARDGAEWCFKFLISENYNPEINGKALSRIYKVLAGNENREDYLILKETISSRFGFPYSWLEPWDKESLSSDWTAFCSGEGLKRSLAAYLDGRTRIALRDFYGAVSADLKEGSWENLQRLKGECWGTNFTAAPSSSEADHQFSNKDPKARIDEALMFQGQRALNIKSILIELTGLGVGGGAAVGTMHGMMRYAGATYGLGLFLGYGGYEIYQMHRARSYSIVNPDLDGIVPTIVKKCMDMIREDAKRDDSGYLSIRRAEGHLLESVGKLVAKSTGKHFYTLWLYNHDPDEVFTDGDELLLTIERDLRNFVATMAEEVSKYIPRVLALKDEDASFWMDADERNWLTGRKENLMPESVKFVRSIDAQAEKMRIMIAESGFADPRFRTPLYFLKVFPRGYGVKSLPQDALS